MKHPIEQLEKLCAEATAEETAGFFSRSLTCDGSDPDYIDRLHIAARTAIPDLCARVREMEAAGTWADAAAFLDKNAGSYCECRENEPVLMCEKHAQTFSRSVLEEEGKRRQALALTPAESRERREMDDAHLRFVDRALKSIHNVTGDADDTETERTVHEWSLKALEALRKARET